MSVSPELMTELLGLPEPERVDLVQRLLESLRKGAASDDLDEDERAELHWVLTVTGLVRYLVLFVIDLQTRRVQIGGVVRQPYGAWMAQVARNLTDGVDGFLIGKRYLLMTGIRCSPTSSVACLRQQG